MWVIDDQQYLGQLDGFSRAAQFADGLFETMVVKKGQIQALNYHAQRLGSGCARLDIKLPDNNLTELFIAYAHKFVELSGLESGVLKVIVSRGNSERGYGYDDVITPKVTAFFNPLPQYNENSYEHGVSVKCLATECSIQKQMAGLKHLNRLENVLAKKELGSEAFEGLMFNHLGYVIEGTSSNIFFEKNNQLFTPKLNVSGVAGVMRSCIINHAESQNIIIKVDDIAREQLDQFEQGFICNSVMGIMPIAQLDGRSFKIGPQTKAMQEACKDGVVYG
ncbi:MAG: 4-amino-4-deoxychorismate lyase [Oceanicoccus sp.]|jgi:4-amino-4-deoxychorismate lyase